MRMVSAAALAFVLALVGPLLVRAGEPAGDPLGLAPRLEALIRSRAPRPLARIVLPELGDFGLSAAEREGVEVHLSLHRRARIEGAVPITVAFTKEGGELRRATVTARVTLAAPIVKRGQLVTLRLAHGSLRIAARGKAREDGQPGDSIRVKNIDSRREVVGVVAQDGAVDVSL